MVLVGWSYGSVPIEGVADRMPERLRLLVNLDGGTVREGHVIDDLSDDPPELAEQAGRPGGCRLPVRTI